MRYGIFGGSFDPFHNGHLAVVEAALHSGLIDRLWVIPAGLSPFKVGKTMTLPPYRYLMTVEALKHIPNCEVTPMELLRPGSSYTIETVEHFISEQSITPKEPIYLFGGSDIFLGLHRWYRAGDLLKLVHPVMVSRPGCDPADLHTSLIALKESFGVEILRIPIREVDVSSSEVRENKDSEKSASTEPLPQSVRHFIQKHDLYSAADPLSQVSPDAIQRYADNQALLMKNLKPKRLLHSLNVALLAVTYAKRFGADPDEAFLAGAFHDCTKDLPPQEQLLLAQKWSAQTGETFSEEFPELWHGPAGAAYAQEYFQIKEGEILSGICYHTIGRCKMTTIEKIIYLADKLEPARPYTDLPELRALAETDLDRALLACMKQVKAAHARAGKPFHPETERAMEYLSRQIRQRDDEG